MEGNLLFQRVRSGEITGLGVGKRPFFLLENTTVDYSERGVVAVEHNGQQTPPIEISFCKTSRNSHILGLCDEDGYVTLFDTRTRFAPPSHPANTPPTFGEARIGEWLAHHNSVFDLCWIKEDHNLLTASGDQTVKLWDTENKKCTGVLTGHVGSVKSLCSHPTNSDILVSGSRDGSFLVWDLRCSGTSKGRCRETCISPTALVNGAHLSARAKRVRRGKAASMSITSVLYLKDGVSIATAGAVDSIVKFWDTRNLKAQITQACPNPDSSNTKETRLHGISSLSQDSNGVFLTASCMDNRIYLYNILQLDKGPMQSFTGCLIESFFVKSAISPDAAHILSGSSDGNAYIWQVNKPKIEPITLKNHDGEVTAVDWCPSEAGKLATTSDDFTLRFWNIRSSYCSSARPPSSTRRRVMSVPTDECRELLSAEASSPTKSPGKSHSGDEPFQLLNSTDMITEPTVSTPVPQKEWLSSALHPKEALEKTPEAAMKSPSSVLNPPSSLKRKTILDYFAAT